MAYHLLLITRNFGMRINNFKKFLGIILLIILIPSHLLAWCSEPIAPSAPSTSSKPAKPIKPSVPFCVNEYTNAHTCDDWTINSYNNDVSYYNNQLQSYNYEIDDYQRKLQYYVTQAQGYSSQVYDYADCEIRSLDF